MPEITISIEDIEAFIERMEDLVGRWRALEEPLFAIRREMADEMADE